MDSNAMVIHDFGGKERDEFVNAPSPIQEDKPMVIKDRMRMRDEPKMDSYAIPDEPESYGTSLDDNQNPVQVKDSSKKAEEIDFDSIDFEKSTELIKTTAQLNNMKQNMNNARAQKHEIASHSFQNLKNVSLGDVEGAINTPDEVIQYHLDKWDSFDALNKHLEGPITDKKVNERIESFFEHPITHEILELSGETAVNNKSDELQFKRGMLLYFKQNDEYLAKIEEETKKLDEATAELTADINNALNMNSNTLYKYVKFLIERSEKPTDEDALAEAYRKYVTSTNKDMDDHTLDDMVTKKMPTLIREDDKRKKAELKKAKAIRSAYTLENMIELVEKRPSIIDNALKDFRNDNKIQDIGKRYQGKLKTAKINLNLFGFLSNDPKDSLEYKVIPLDDYPTGLEGFTVFFIIRSLGMSLPNKEDEVFHSALYITLGQLLNNQMDEKTADIMKEGIKKFLSYFEGK